ncbi:hypothetical protein PICMEDRAFT_14975 [Pichia membranifaciens NRRL Y-2026]|uniref:Uncharacterized protein n=1 Tax=Pichia membranifaciens NRRL Y-2026 TaxID=763406 RepID=A0A1E3NU20_9ASCO|nr:hypothetical protein PICMEDRAFT_14975 [Pichia membranifaciens NRRL Y-2026]ODQ49540.1 hypothetical protein PICMEDRAFT_14975 [Pichia membranifaciens NRRL Y-2026]
MLFDAMRQSLTRQTSISAPTLALGFMGGVVLPILLTNALASKQPNAIYQGKDKVDHVDVADEDYDFNDLLF